MFGSVRVEFLTKHFNCYYLREFSCEISFETDCDNNNNNNRIVS